MPIKDLPDRVVGQAQQYAGASEMVRYNIATMLLTQSRQEGRDADAEILAALGYRDADEYWRVAISEPMPATSFARLLDFHQIDPAEQLYGFDPISRVLRLLYVALNLAIDSGESFFIGNPRSLKDAMLRPRDAALWLLSMPKRKELVPAGLRALLEGKRRKDRPTQEAVTQWMLDKAGKLGGKKI